MKPSAMLTQLDAETRELQPGIDARWLELLSGAATRDQYRHHLACTYGFESPFECALSYTPDLVVPDRRERTRAGLIAQDLLALGMPAGSVTALPQCPDVAAFRDAPEALGWKYVIERPTQLHGAIKRNLVSRYPDLENAASYLSASQGVAAARWQQLGMLLDEVAAKRHAAAAIIGAARSAYGRMLSWYTAVHGKHAAAC